ncbi:MAG: hypothetical protein ABI035_15260 [Gemmatimonadaceae bacterium]
MFSRGGVVACLALVCASAPATALAQGSAPFSLNDFLRTTIGLDASQVTTAQQGRAATKLLHTDLNRDVAVFGVVGIHVTREAYLARLRNAQTLISARAQSYGIIEDPIRPNDMLGVFFDGSEWSDLKSCKFNDCSFKLPLTLMQQFAQSVDWRGDNAKAQVDSIMLRNMQALVTDYRARGSAAMPRYDDTNGIQASGAFAALLAQSQFLREYAPAFHDYLLNYPSSKLDGATDVMYWAMDRIPRLHPTFTINQLIVYTPPSGVALLARKQIFADHYFEAAFEVSAVFDAPDLVGGPGVYVVSVRRYRFDSLPGGILNIRGRVRSQLQKLMQSDLDRERQQAEGSASS